MILKIRVDESVSEKLLTAYGFPGVRTDPDPLVKCSAKLYGVMVHFELEFTI